jgi:hypothetical protein
VPRTFTTAQRTASSASQLACYGKLEVTDPDGTWRDVGALGGVDWFNTATISDSLDANTISFSAVVLRDTGNLSLAPYRSDSTINRNALSAYAPMLDLHRYWRVSSAVVGFGVTPVSGDWNELGRGILDTIDIQDPATTITLTGRGMEADLLDAFIPRARTYGSNASPIAMETVLQSMLDDQLGASIVTLYTPVSPSFVMRNWAQAPDNFMGALTAVAEKAGFVLRYRYDASNVLRFTLAKPNRNPSAVDWTIGASEYLALPSVKIDLTGVRNFIELKYLDATSGLTILASPAPLTGTVTASSGSATFSASQAGVIAVGSVIVVAGVGYTVTAFGGTTTATLAGTPTFSASPWTTSASLTRYGLRYMAVDLAGDSQVSSTTQAQGMADAIRSDLELPALEQAFETFGFWFVQLGDYGQFTANGVQYNADQYGGVTSYTHTFANGTLRTILGVRGKPAGRYRTYLTLGSDSAVATPVSAGGPSLDVSGVAGSPYTINYTASGATPTLSINGVTSSLPASPFTVARPAAGALPLEYAISITAGGQTVSDSVTVMPIDWNTVTPDLNVVPSAPATGEQSFTVTATDPSGGAVPPTWVLLRGTTGYTGGGSAIADGVEFGITSTDNVIHVYRPAFDTIAQSSAQFRATISGAGSEKIQRSIMNQVKTTFGPTLDVVGTAGSPYTIAYTSSGGTPTLKINGSASSLPASPFTVARPAAGGTPLEYAISITADGQTISDSVTVQPIDKDTVTPDLVATPSVPTATEQRFTVTATDPSGGAVPPAFVLLRGTTGMTGGGSAISDGVEFGITSTDNVIHVTRPAFDTVAQASAQFRSTITGAGTEVIQRSIANQVKTTFGPSLEVTPTSGALTYSIGYTGTPTLKINGSATALPGTNPFSVTRPAAGSPSLEYAFTTVADGQTVTDSVTVLPIDKDTITPDLAVVPSTPTATTQDFSPTATNPSGGGTPGVYVIVRGTTATSAGGAYTYSDGVEYAFASSGAVLTVARPAFGTTAQASVQFRATIAGAGQETIQRSIPNQVKTSFGPSLVVTPGALTSTALSIAYSGTYDTLTLAINGVPSTLPASPISVTLASTAGTYTFTATKDGVSNTQTIAIPAAGSASAPPLFSSLAIGVSSYALDQLALSWSSSGAPSGATFNVTVFEQTGITNTSVGNSATFAGVTSPYTYQCTNDIDAAGTRNKTFRFSVEMVSGSTVAGASTTVSQVVLSNT